MSWLVNDRDALSEPTRAQEQACESLAERHDRVEIHNRPDGIAEATCLGWTGRGYSVRCIMEVNPDGTKRRKSR